MSQMDSGPSSGGSSFIDPDSTVEGTIRTDRDLRVEGTISGTINCEGVLYVAEGALVDAEIDASSIIVAGEMSGTVRCHGRLEIRSTGIVRGDVRTGALVILEGAQYEGQIAMEAGEAPLQPEEEVEELAIDSELEESESESEYSFLRRFAPDDDDDADEDQ